MISVGIIGAESKHSKAFAELLKSGMFPDARFGGIYGGDLPEKKQDGAWRSGGNRVFDSETALIRANDAVLICYRDGSRHLPCARMCAESGKPFFVDKPFSITVKDADEIIQNAVNADVPMMGGSTLVFDSQLNLARQAIPEARGLWVSYAADLHSVYHGYHFYGSHLAEIMLTLRPGLPLSVSAFADGGSVTAVADYPNGFQAVLQSNPQFTVPVVTVLSLNRVQMFQLDDTSCYRNGLSAFINMIKTENPPIPYIRYRDSVASVNAVMESIRSGKPFVFVNQKVDL